ncbi:hypothetical protein B6U96_14525 [Archaeoglobales archaeon ex4484_92]|nr:MAG: hypothetical protein B6U96_14525 [Archaeoglobales archaeon ex4484_92]
MRLLPIILLLLAIQPSCAYVVVTISDLKPIVSAVCGEKIEVYSLLKPNVDPHRFSLGWKEVELLKGADLIVLVNSDLLSFEGKIREQYKNVLDFEDYGIELEDFPGYPSNPHGYWLKPENAIKIAYNVKERLSEIYPKYSEEFDINFKKFKKRVERAEEEALIIARDLRGRKFVAMVPGVCYIASSLKVKVAYVLLSEGSGFVSASELREVKEKLENGEYVGIIVPEFMRNAKGGEIAEQIARDTGCKIAYVRFSSGDLDFDAILLSNAARMVSAIRVKGESSNTMVYILSVLCLVEGALLFFMRLRT